MLDISELIKKHAFKVFLFVLLLGILARIISFLVLPEDTYSDAVFHLDLVRTMIETGSIAEIQAILPMPLYHFALFIFFVITGLPLEMPFVRIIPFVISLMQILFAYLLFRELFSKKKEFQKNLPSYNSKELQDKILVIMGVAFVASHAVLSIFSTVNFTGPIAAMFVLSSFWLLAKINNSFKINYFEIALFIVSVFALSLTKLNATIAVPALIIGLAVVLYYKKVSFVRIGTIVAILLILSSAWFAFNSLTIGSPLGFSSGEVSAGITEEILTTRITAERALFFPLNFWYFPNSDLFEKVGLSNFYIISLILFFIAILPLFISMLIGMYDSFKKKKIVYLAMFLAIVFISFIVIKRGFESRLFLPVLPLFGIFVVYGFSSIKNKYFKSAIILSFLIFGLFSFGYVTGSALYFNSQNQDVSGLYEFMSDLPDNSKILSSSEHRRISFNTGIDSHFIHNMSKMTSEAQLLSPANENGFTHYAVTCRDDSVIDSNLKASLISNNSLSEIYRDDCSVLYVINYD